VDQYFHEAWQELTKGGSPFSWSVVDIRGIPTRAYDSAPPNLGLIWSSTVAYSEKDYLIYKDERLTYKTVHGWVDSLAAYLASTGVVCGERVAIAMRNYPEWVVAYWAIIKLGATVVGINAWWTGSEIDYGLKDCQAKVLICDEERLSRIYPYLEDLRSDGSLHILAVRTDTDLPSDSIHWDEAMAVDNPLVDSVAVETDDDACIFYTSGTTGRPKGAVLTHRGIVTNLLNMAFWEALSTSAQARAIAAGKFPVGSNKVQGDSNPGSVLAVPLFHVSGCNSCLIPVTATGGRLVLMHRWDPERALELIERERTATFTGVPTMARELINSPDFTRRDTSSLEYLGGGGAAVQPDLVEKIEARIQGRPSTGYGLTEVNGAITINSAHFFLAKPESAGPALPVMETRIVGEDGVDQLPNHLGELWVRGANVFRGYLNQPEANREVLTDGWFHTGDIGYLDDDGFLFLVDRAKDMVLRGGENVYSAEVEAAIYKHPAVAEAAVFAVPDERLGEVVGAAILLLADRTLSADELREHVSEHIAAYKVPSHIWFVDEPFPQNANGKFLKRKLREILLNESKI